MKRTFLFLLVLMNIGCSVEALPPKAGPLELEIILTTNTTPEEDLYLLEVVDLVEQTMNSNAFRKELINSDLSNTGGRSKAEVYSHIMTSYKPLKISMEEIPDGIGGRYNRETETIKLDSDRLKHTHISNIAGTIAHEWLHSIGYNHNGFGERTAVPYVVGDIVTKLNR